MRFGEEASYITLLKGVFPAGAVDAAWGVAPFPPPVELQEAIDRAWDQLSPNPHYNGCIARLESWAADGEKLRLQLCPTDYKTLLYSNQHVAGIVARWGEKQLSHALGISAVVVGADGQLLLMQRSDRVGEYPGHYDVFGGHIEAPDEGEAPDLFYSMAKELQEELALPADAFDLSCFGLLQTLTTRKPELLFISRCQLESGALIRAAREARDKYEYSNLLKVPAHPQDIAGFLRQHRERTSPSAIGCLEMYAATL